MRIAALTLLLGSLGLAACDDSNNDVIVAPGTRTGTFFLQTVNGQELPAVVLDSLSPSLVIEATSGAIALGANNAFIEIIGLRLVVGDVGSTSTEENTVTRARVCTGTFTVAVDTLTFIESGTRPDCGRTFTGVLGDNRLTTFLRGIPAVYGR